MGGREKEDEINREERRKMRTKEKGEAKARRSRHLAETPEEGDSKRRDGRRERFDKAAEAGPDG